MSASHGAPLRVLGLDPGSRATGWGVVLRTGPALTSPAWGVVRLDPEAAFATRLRLVHEAVRALIAEHLPDVVVVEEAFLGKNARSALRLGETRGACVVAAAIEGRTVAELTPASVKKALSGRGDADKEHVRTVVRATLGLGDARLALDASDALALALAAHARVESAHALGVPVASLPGGRRRGQRARWSAQDLLRLGRTELRGESHGG